LCMPTVQGAVPWAWSDAAASPSREARAVADANRRDTPAPRPLASFIASNEGQDSNVNARFVGAAVGLRFGFGNSRVWVNGEPASEGVDSAVLLTFPGSLEVEPRGVGVGPTINYLIGPAPSAWVTGIAGYGRIQYASLYPGVDLEFHLTDAGLKYEFQVAAGAAASTIEIMLSGVTG